MTLLQLPQKAFYSGSNPELMPQLLHSVKESLSQNKLLSLTVRWCTSCKKEWTTVRNHNH